MLSVSGSVLDGAVVAHEMQSLGFRVWGVGYLDGVVVFEEAAGCRKVYPNGFHAR